MVGHLCGCGRASPGVLRNAVFDEQHQNGNLRSNYLRLSYSENPKKDVKPRPQATKNVATVKLNQALSLDYLANVLEDHLTGDKLLGTAFVHRLDGLVVVSLPSDTMFGSGEVELQKDAKEALFRMGGLIATIGNRIDVRGHTDPEPLSDKQFDLKWAISLARAAAVATGVTADRIRTANTNLRVSRYAVCSLGCSNPRDGAARTGAAGRRSHTSAFGTPLMSLLRLIAIGVLSIAAQIPAIAQEDVTVRGGAHSEFGRIVFDWTSPVGYDAKITGRNLIVRFDRPMQADFSRAMATLRDYASGARLSGDNRTATVSLKDDFNLKTFENGSSIVVDVVRKNGASQTTPNASVPSLKVRKGQHAEYDRLVFDWTRPVEYEVSRNGRTRNGKFQPTGAHQHCRPSIAFGSRV